MTIPFLYTSHVAFALDGGLIRWAIVDGRFRSPISIIWGTTECDASGQVVWPPEVDSALANGKVGILADERFIRHNRYPAKTAGADSLAHGEILDRFLTESEHHVDAREFCFGVSTQRNSEDQIVSGISQRALDRSTKQWMDDGVTVTAVSSLVHELPYALAYLTTFLERDTFVVFASNDYYSQIHYNNGSFSKERIIIGTPQECAGELLATYLEEKDEATANPMLVCGPESESLLTALNATDSKIARAATLTLPWKNQSPVPETHLDVAGLAIRLFFEQYSTFDFRGEHEVVSVLNQFQANRLRSASLAAAVVTGTVILVLASLFAISHHSVNRAEPKHSRLTTLAAEARQSQRLAAASDEEQRDYNTILNRQSNVAGLIEDVGRSIPGMTTLSELTIAPNDSSGYRLLTIRGESRNAASLTSLAVQLNNQTTMRDVEITRVRSRALKNVANPTEENHEQGVIFEIQGIAIDQLEDPHD